MVLFMIGLGLNNEKDITLNGLEAIRKSDYVFLESYTSKLYAELEDLEKLYGKKIIIADRDLVESKSDEILNKATDNNVSFLVVGDVFSATTHVDMFLRAKEKKIEIRIINNASILTAIGIVGLELYKYGKVASLPYFESKYKPSSSYDIIRMNIENGLHTLLLLDIQKERMMTIREAIMQLLEIEKKKKIKVLKERIVGCARIGTENQFIKYDYAKNLVNIDFGPPLHCLVVPGKLHFIEEEMLNLFSDEKR